MPPSVRSSKLRFRAYRRRRRAAGAREQVTELRAEPGASLRAAKPRRTFFGLFRAYWGLLRGHRGTLTLCLLTLTISSGLALLMPYSTKIVIDYVLTERPGPAGLAAAIGVSAEAMPSRKELLWIIAGALLAVTAVSVSLGVWGRWQATRLTHRMRVAMRRRSFEHAVRLPLHRVHALKSGGVASMLREDAGAVGDLVFHLLYNPWRAVVQLIGTLVILALVDWRMLAGALGLLPVVWLTHRTWIGRIRPLFRDVRTTRQAIDAEATEAFGGMRVVRGFNRSQAEAARFTRDNHFMARQEILTWWWSRGIEIAWQVLIPLATIVVVLYAGSRIIDSNFGAQPAADPFTVGDLVMFLLYLGWLLGPLESLVTSATGMQSALSGLDRILDLLDEPREFADAPSKLALRPEAVRGRITLERVGFAYPVARATDPLGRGVRREDEPDRLRPVLEGIDLDVMPGETVALVGPSGAGKTTLCNLVARFYDPTEGRILLDGTDLRDIDPESYRRLLGIVEQDVFLFDGTVGENIGYARRGATREQIESAARAANAHGFILDLEQGYDTVIGERGVRLSGGQKQRLAIARAILADPKILILDEATSNLDSESEALIQRSLARLMRGRTSFVIAHRLSTIRHADRIVVIEAGRVTESGTHDELTANGGHYARILRMQLSGDSGADAAGPDVHAEPTAAR